MKTFVEFITYFVLLYPLLAAIVWTILGIIHHLTKKELDEAKTELPLTIIMPVYNEEYDIEEHIRHNLNLNYNNYKMIVIDDRSTDNSKSIIESIKSDKLVFYKNKENLGKAKTLNNIINKVNTDYFIVIDSDTKLEENSLRKINNRIQYDIQNNDQDKIAGYTGNITVHSTNKNKVFRMQKIEYRAFIDMIKRSQFIVFKSVMTLSGACSVYNKEIFKTIGGFSEENATEDINISWRFNLNNYKLIYLDDLYASVTTPSNVFDLVLQRKRWTNGLLQTMFKYKSDFIKPRNIDLKIYTLEIVISSLWALSLVFVNFYYITMLFTNYFEDLRMMTLLFPTSIMFIFSTILAVTSYAISDNDKESKKELIQYYMLFPLAYFYVQPIGFLLGAIETFKKKKNEKWRRVASDRSRIAFATMIDVILNIVLLQILLEIFTDLGVVFDTYLEFLSILIIYITFIILYYMKLYLGEQSINKRLGMFKSPSFYIIIMFIVIRFIKALAIYNDVLEAGNIFKLNLNIFAFSIILSWVIFEIVIKFIKKDNNQ